MQLPGQFYYKYKNKLGVLTTCREVTFVTYKLAMHGETVAMRGLEDYLRGSLHSSSYDHNTLTTLMRESSACIVKTWKFLSYCNIELHL